MARAQAYQQGHRQIEFRNLPTEVATRKPASVRWNDSRSSRQGDCPSDEDSSKELTRTSIVLRARRYLRRKDETPSDEDSRLSSIFNGSLAQTEASDDLSSLLGPWKGAPTDKQGGPNWKDSYETFDGWKKFENSPSRTDLSFHSDNCHGAKPMSKKKYLGEVQQSDTRSLPPLTSWDVRSNLRETRRKHLIAQYAFQRPLPPSELYAIDSIAEDSVPTPQRSHRGSKYVASAGQVIERGDASGHSAGEKSLSDTTPTKLGNRKPRKEEGIQATTKSKRGNRKSSKEKKNKSPHHQIPGRTIDQSTYDEVSQSQSGSDDPSESDMPSSDSSNSSAGMADPEEYEEFGLHGKNLCAPATYCYEKGDTENGKEVCTETMRDFMFYYRQHSKNGFCTGIALAPSAPHSEVCALDELKFEWSDYIPDDVLYFLQGCQEEDEGRTRRSN